MTLVAWTQLMGAQHIFSKYNATTTNLAKTNWTLLLRLMPGFRNSSYPENLELSLEQETVAF